MTTQPTEPAEDVQGRRAVAGIWLVGSTLIGMPMFFLTFASDLPSDRVAGLMLVVLTVLGIAMALISLSSPARFRFRATLAGSAMWFISGVLVFGSQAHLLDAMWAGGVPILTAVAATAGVLLIGRPLRDR